MRLKDGGMIDRSHEMYGKPTPCDADEEYFVVKKHGASSDIIPKSKTCHIERMQSG